jgi:acyl-CoA thioester hydrolase
MSEAAHHDLAVRVYYEDTDAAGIVYYANYLRYAERARTEMMREIGFKSSDIMAEEGIALGVRHCTLDYKRPARLDDELRVSTRVGKIGGASIELCQVVWRGDEELVSMNVKLGCMTLDGRAARLPAEVRHAFQQQIED